MSISNLLLTISGLCFVICAIPQLVRNWKYRNTITQSLLTNCLILTGTVLSVIAYFELQLFTAMVFLFVEAIITIVLIVQIVLWRNNKKKQALIRQTEGVRTVFGRMRGVK